MVDVHDHDKHEQKKIIWYDVSSIFLLHHIRKSIFTFSHEFDNL